MVHHHDSSLNAMHRWWVVEIIFDLISEHWLHQLDLDQNMLENSRYECHRELK